MPRTAQDVTSDLHALLAAAQVPGPYILVAHSLGGLFVRLYAQTYPDQVRGLVLVDVFPAELPTLFRSQWPAYRQVLNNPLPQFANNPDFEQMDVDASINQIEKAPPLRRMPSVVLTKTEPFARLPSSVGFAFEDLELIRIYARHFGGNIASGRVMEKARMKKERILRQCVMKNGVMMDMVEYAILKSEYNNG